MTHATITDYLAAQPEIARACLEEVRAAIRDALPDGEEVISYRIPAIRVAGRVAIFFAGWKSHYAIYPLSEALLAAFGPELAGRQTSKGTASFPLDQPVPVDLIGRMAAFMGDEARARAGQAGKRTRSRRSAG